MDLSSNRDLDMEPKADINPSNRDHDFLKDIMAPTTEGELLELHTKLEKYKEYGIFIYVI